MDLGKIKKDLHSYSKKDMDTLYKYYKVNNINELIYKIYNKADFKDGTSGTVRSIFSERKSDFPTNDINEFIKTNKNKNAIMTFIKSLKTVVDYENLFYKIAFSDLDQDIKISICRDLLYKYRRLVAYDILPEMDTSIAILIYQYFAQYVGMVSRDYYHNAIETLINRVFIKLNYENEKNDILYFIFNLNNINTFEKFVTIYPDINLDYKFNSVKIVHTKDIMLFELMRSNLEMIKLFVNKYGKDPLLNIRDEFGSTLLFSVTNDYEKSKYLVDLGIDINVQNNLRENVLMEIINPDRDTEDIIESMPESIAFIKLLHSTGKLDLEKQNKMGQTVLMLAGKLDGYQPMFSLLLELGANVNHKDIKGNTLLMLLSCLVNDKKIDDILTENLRILVADVNINPHNPTRVLKALDTSKSFNIDYNIQNNDGNTALMTALICPHRNAVIKYLVDKTDVWVTNNDGNTALHLAWSDTNIEYILKKIDYSPFTSNYVNQKNSKGQTALMINYEKYKVKKNERYISNILVLIKYGANILDLSIQDLVPIYELVEPMISKKLSDIVDGFSKDELQYFNEQCPKEMYFTKQNKPIEHLTYLTKCINKAQTMIKYAPESIEEHKLRQKYNKHPYFQKKKK